MNYLYHEIVHIELNILDLINANNIVSIITPLCLSHIDITSNCD